MIRLLNKNTIESYVCGVELGLDLAIGSLREAAKQLSHNDYLCRVLNATADELQVSKREVRKS